MAELSQAEQKKLVGAYAVDKLLEEGLIFSGMKIGLGTGSTAMPAVERLAFHLHSGTIRDIKAVATSFQTTIACEQLGIPVYSMNAAVIGGQLDLAIDGADEISPENHLIKGGGAALLLEKIVAYNAKQFVVVADSSKDVPHLGTGFALPVEIIAEARSALVRQLEGLGLYQQPRLSRRHQNAGTIYGLRYETEQSRKQHLGCSIRYRLPEEQYQTGTAD
jgi:ribose 5-phosphate isomerase A